MVCFEGIEGNLLPAAAAAARLVRLLNIGWSLSRKLGCCISSDVACPLYIVGSCTSCCFPTASDFGWQEHLPPLPRPVCRVCLGGGKPCPSVAQQAAAASGGSSSAGGSGSGSSGSGGSSSGSSSGSGGSAGAAASAVDTTPPLVLLGNASCAASSAPAGTAAVSNVRAVTAAGTEVMITAVPVGESGAWLML